MIPRHLVGTLAVVIATITVAAPAEVFTYRCKFTAMPDMMFPQSMGTNEIVERQLKGYHNDEITKRSVEETKRLLNKRPTVVANLTQSTDGQWYSIEILNLNLPANTPQIRHEVFENGINIKWFETGKGVSSTGYVDKGWKNGLVWSPIVETLLGLSPSGIKFQKPSLGPLQASYFEPAQEHLSSRRSSQPLDSQRHFVIDYKDDTRRSINKLHLYWNIRAKHPFCEIQFFNSRLNDDQHTFSGFKLTRFRGEKAIWTEEMTLTSHALDVPFVTAPIPKGHAFLDRRLGEQKTYSFFYNGKSLPSENEIQDALDYSKQGERDPTNSNLWRFGVGVLLLLVGITMTIWIRRKALVAS